jgi:signal transduction histidine kinase
MDVAMPGINGVDATREITEIAPNVRVLALSGHNDGFFVKGMLEAGARGYLLKDVAVNELVTAVKTLSEGRIYVSPSVIDTLTYSFLSTVSELSASRKKQQQLLDEIQVKNSELERQNAELERFTYSVSHDLRAPLVTIKGFIGLLLKDIERGKGEAIQSDIKQISHATDNMATQLDELLELSRVGRLVNPPVEIDLNEMAASVVALFSDSIAKADVDVMRDGFSRFSRTWSATRSSLPKARMLRLSKLAPRNPMARSYATCVTTASVSSRSISSASSTCSKG